ncbi:hypothetical protein [Kitasatospora sp. NPDC051914]|uniref:hypothetical protein n=1 Tax=Kitasatospora sp. NPDC051914 TaxID=3154945 RepID=UPI00342BBD58
MATRKRTAPPASLSPCGPCHGTGQITESVVVGKGQRRRTVGKQESTCAACWGTGIAPEATT